MRRGQLAPRVVDTEFYKEMVQEAMTERVHECINQNAEDRQRIEAMKARERAVAIRANEGRKMLRATGNVMASVAALAVIPYLHREGFISTEMLNYIEPVAFAWFGWCMKGIMQLYPKH